MSNDSNYIPQPVTQTAESLPRYLTNELRKIQTSISSLQQQINALQAAVAKL